MRNSIAGRDRECQNSCSNLENPARSAAHQTGSCLRNLLTVRKASCYRRASHASYDLNFCMNTQILIILFGLETVELTCIRFWKLLKTTFLTDRAPASSYPSIPPGLSPWRRFMRHGEYEDVWPGVILEVECCACLNSLTWSHASAKGE